jgi:hypothetical protein
VHVGKRRAVVADRVGEGATTIGRTHRIVDEHSVGREQVDPALQIFPFGNRIDVASSGHIVIFHELFFSRQRGSLEMSKRLSGASASRFSETGSAD